MSNTQLVIRLAPSLQGEIRLPGDKSISHRAILLAALAQGESAAENLLVSGVTRVMLAALTALQVPWQLEGTSLRVQSPGRAAWPAPAQPINCGHSATTMRLLAGALAGAGVAAVLDGSPGLRQRPMGRVVTPLQQMGVAISAEDGRAPLTLAPSPLPLRNVPVTLPVASAQVKSCLLLAGLSGDGPLRLVEPGPSRDHTERMLRPMGVRVDTSLPLTTVLYPPAGPLRPFQLTIPGDISAAAFLLVAGLVVPGSRITLPGVGLNPTRTGLLDALRSMGARLEVTGQREVGGEPVGDVTVAATRLHGTVVGGSLVVRMIDEFPALAVAAALAQGRTVVKDAVELRHKESDRITALCHELQAIGAAVTETPDGFIIEGRPLLTGGAVDPHGDHRLAMALAVAGLRCRQGVTVHGAQIVQESFPGFAAALASLGAPLNGPETGG